MQDNLFLHFIVLICTWLNAKFHAKYTLKQVRGNKFGCKLVQNLGQKCNNSPANLYTTNLPQTPNNTAS